MKLINLGKDYLKRLVLDILKRSGRQISPMDMVLLTLEHYDALPNNLIGLELFGRHGLWLTKDYANYCDYLEIWEIEPFYAKWAQRFIPKAAVVCGDSIVAVQTGKLLRRDYNFVVLDCSVGGPFGGKYYEHFDLFPQLIDNLAGEFILTMNIVPNVENTPFPNPNIREWLKRRREFYELKTDEAAGKIELKTLIQIYQRIFQERYHVEVEHTLMLPRTRTIGFLTIKGKKS